MALWSLGALSARATLRYPRIPRILTVEVPISFNVPESPHGTVDTLSSAGTEFDGSKSSSVIVLQNLNFGGIFCSNVSGYVTVSPSGTATYHGGIIAHTGVTGYTVRAAEVELNLTNQEHCEDDDHAQNDYNEYCRSEDDDNRTNDTRSSFTRHGCNVSISLPSTSTLTRTGGGGSMTANNFTFTRTEGYIWIGATLNVGANQASGNYAGSFLVTIVCQ